MKLKKLVLPAFLVLLFFCGGFLQSYYLPSLKTWVIRESKRVALEKASLKIEFKKLNIGLWPPELRAEEISIWPQAKLSQSLAPMKIESLSASPSLTSLFFGEFKIARLQIIQPEVTFIIKDRGNTSSLLPKKTQKTSKSFYQNRHFNFDILKRIPIKNVDIQHMHLLGRIDKENLLLQVNDLSFRGSLNQNKLSPTIQLDMETPRIVFKVRDKVPKLSLSLNTSLSIGAKGLNVKELQLKKGRSFVNASGLISADVEKLEFAKANFEATSFLDLSSLKSWTDEVFPKAEIPYLAGELGLDLKLIKRKDRPFKIPFSAQSQNMQVSKFYIGDLNTQGIFKDQKVALENAEIRNNSGLYTLKDGELSLKEKKFQGTVNTVDVELQGLLNNLGVKEVPLKTQITAEIPCQGVIKPFQIDCQAGFQATNMHLWGKSSGSTILKVKHYSGQGKIQIDLEKVTYQANLQVSDQVENQKLLAPSLGTSQGVISYEDGFKISYKTNELNFKHIENLSNLKIEGAAQISGATAGTSQTGSMKMDVQTKNLIFENYQLGALSSKISYGKGFLKFKEAVGQYKTSQYQGNLSINLLDEQIFVSVKSPFLRLQDISEMIYGQIPLPFSMSGTGQGQIKLWGPLKEVTRLNFDFSSQFFRGLIEKESFDQLAIDIETRDGNWETKKAELTKGPGSLRLDAKKDHQNTMNGQFIGQNFNLQNFESFRRGGESLVGGQLDFDVDLAGSFFAPRISTDVRLSNLTVASYEYGPSQIKLSINPNRVTGDAKLFNKSVNTSFEIPLKKNSPLLIKFEADDWNFVPFFAFLQSSRQLEKYNSLLTSQIVINSKSGDIWNANGSMSLPDFLFSFEDEVFRNDEVLDFKFSNGSIEDKKLRLSSEKYFVEGQVRKLNRKNIDSEITGKIDLKVISFLLPFFENLAGLVDFSLKAKGETELPELLGSAVLEKGLLKIQNFPYPFTEISGDLLFDNSRLLVNSLKSQFAEGHVSTNGNLRFLRPPNSQSINSVETNIDVTLEKLNLDYPKGVKSLGSGQLKITGSNFPYQVRGLYEIDSSEITKEFQSEDNQVEVKSSQYLPDVIKKEDVEPIEFEIDFVLNNPLVVKNSLMNSTLTGAGQFVGTLSQPSILGKFDITKNSILFVRDTQFEVSEANLKFESRKELDPELFVNASSRVQEFDITLLVQGLASQPIFQWNSQPPLTEQDIISLLALGITSTNQENTTSEDQAASSGAMIGQAVLAETGFNQFAKKRLGLNFQISQVYNQDQETASQKITVRGNLSPDWEWAVSRNFLSGNEAELGYRVNQNLSLVGRFEGREAEAGAESITDDTNTADVFGLDLEYRFQFR